MPILGIIASQNYPRVTNSYESIATVTVGSGGSATVTFSSIPATYTHLQIRSISRGTYAGSNTPVRFQVNSDTGFNYATHWITGNGSSASSGAGVSVEYLHSFRQPADTAISNTFGTGITDLLDYTSTNKYKTVRSLSGYDVNGGGELHLYSGVWMNTNAITSITMFPNVGNFAQYSSFALYGIKGA